MFKKMLFNRYKAMLDMMPFNGTPEEMLKIVDELRLPKSIEYTEDIVNGVWSGFPKCCIWSYAIEGRNGAKASDEHIAMYGVDRPDRFNINVGYIRCRECEGSTSYIEGIRNGYFSRVDGKLKFSYSHDKLYIDDVIEGIRKGVHHVSSTTYHNIYEIKVSENTYAIESSVFGDARMLPSYYNRDDRSSSGYLVSANGNTARLVGKGSTLYKEHKALFEACEAACAIH